MKWCIRALPLLLLVGIIASFHLLTPSLDRAWAEDQAVLASAAFKGDTIYVSNVRNFRYSSAREVEEGYYDEIFQLSKLERVDLSLSTLPVIGGAHPILLFSFSDGKHVALSVEARREKNETYSAFRGLLPSYELVYVISDEQDAIGRRLLERETTTIVYPLRISDEGMQQLFVSLLERANDLTVTPEFYNTLTHNCVNNLVRIANAIKPGSLPALHIGTIFPKYSDNLLHKEGFIDTGLSLEEARIHFAIDRGKAIEALGSDKFSEVIRSQGEIITE